MAKPSGVEIDYLSATVVQFATVANGVLTSEATGFMYSKNESNYLITNWHVVTGINAETKIREKIQPDRIRVWHHQKDFYVQWKCIEIPLYEQGEPRWIEHPGNQVERDYFKIDIVAIPLEKIEGIQYICINQNQFNHNIDLEVGDAVSIIGFPLGEVVNGKVPIWKSGHIASDLGVPYLGNPVFLIDATTKPAMSGSPVVAKRTKYRQVVDKEIIEFNRVYKFLGVYSGRTSEMSDIGMVWNAELIDEIIESSKTKQERA